MFSLFQWRVLHSVRRSFWLLLLLRCCILLPAPCSCGDVTHTARLEVTRGVTNVKTRHAKTESPLYPNDVSITRQATNQVIHEVTLGGRHHSDLNHRHKNELTNTTHGKTKNPPRFDKRKQVTVIEEAVIADKVKFVKPHNDVKPNNRVISRVTRGDDTNDDNVLHIGGIFPIGGEGGWQGGQACMPAANLALEDVNRRKDLLPGFKLKLHSNDSEVSFFRLLNFIENILSK